MICHTHNLWLWGADVETETKTRKRARTERRAAPRLDARWPGQTQMIRAAQLAFGATILDCALLDTSRGGARVHLLVSMEVPEISTLRLRCGSSWTVQRRWRKGDEVGFKVVGGDAPPA